MATSQDFATWTCTSALNAEYLMFALMAEGDQIRDFGAGTTHTTIYFPEIRAFTSASPRKTSIVRSCVALSWPWLGLTKWLRDARALVDAPLRPPRPVHPRQSVPGRVGPPGPRRRTRECPPRSYSGPARRGWLAQEAGPRGARTSVGRDVAGFDVVGAYGHADVRCLAFGLQEDA